MIEGIAKSAGQRIHELGGKLTQALAKIEHDRTTGVINDKTKAATMAAAKKRYSDLVGIETARIINSEHSTAHPDVESD